MMEPTHPGHPSSINRFDAFGDYDYVDTSPPQNAPSFESLKCEELCENSEEEVFQEVLCDHSTGNLGWVDFDFGCSTILPSCSASSANFSSAQAEPGTTKIKVIQTKVRHEMCHPAHSSQLVSTCTECAHSN